MNDPIIIAPWNPLQRSQKGFNLRLKRGIRSLNELSKRVSQQYLFNITLLLSTSKNTNFSMLLLISIPLMRSQIANLILSETNRSEFVVQICTV